MYPIGGARRTESNDANPKKGGGHGHRLHSLAKHYPECGTREGGGESGCSRAGSRDAVVSGEKSVRRPARDLVVCREDVRGKEREVPWGFGTKSHSLLHIFEDNAPSEQ